jgi:hypothetical protein
MRYATRRDGAIRPTKLRWMGALLLLSLAAEPALASTVLTFDVAGGVTNFQPVPSDYGDNVAASPQAGHSYGFVADGRGPTPDVLVDYGAPGELPALWTSGYGDLANVYFNDQDGDSTLTVTLTAAPGFHAILFGFDVASYSAGGQTIPGLSVLDGQGGTLFSQGSTFVPGSSNGGHTTISFGPAGLEAQVLTLVIDLTGLGTVSDNIGIDNLVFAQAIPEADVVLLLAAGLLAGGARRRLRS